MFSNWFKKSPQRVYAPPAPKRPTDPRAGTMTLKGKPKPLTEEIKADIKRQIMSLDDVPRNERKFVINEAIICIQDGGDLGRFAWALGEIGIEKQRAATIARGVNRRTQSLQEVERWSALGIKEAIWKHAGSSCFVDTQEDNVGWAQNSSHEAMHGGKFKISDWAMVAGRKTLPGYDWGCKCYASPIIPGIDD